MKAFVIDISKCSGCYNCQIACKDEHVGNDWMPYSKPQPNSGQFWMKVDQKDHGQVPKVRVEYTPRPCMHCANPKCLEVAPDAGYVREDGLVILDPLKAKGHKEIVDACPYGAVYWNTELEIPQKCTGCAHLVDKGMIPHCVDLCDTGALRFGDEEDFVEEIGTAEVLLPESGCKPRVYYLNRPHLFLAADVYDPEADEIVEGATVTLTMPDGTTRQTQTDDFGDFYFKRIDPGTYQIEIDADGFEKVCKKNIEINASLNLGSIPLSRR